MAGLIVNALSAFGSLAAVWAALYLAREQGREKLQLSNSIVGIIEVGARQQPKERYVRVRAVNAGAREVVITGVGWQVGLLKKRHFLQIPPANTVSATLPVRLRPGEDAQFMFDVEVVRRTGANLKEAIEASWLTRSFNRFVRVGVYTSLGLQALTPVSPEVRVEVMTADLSPKT